MIISVSFQQSLWPTSIRSVICHRREQQRCPRRLFDYTTGADALLRKRWSVKLNCRPLINPRWRNKCEEIVFQIFRAVLFSFFLLIAPNVTLLEMGSTFSMVRPPGNKKRKINTGELRMWSLFFFKKKRREKMGTREEKLPNLSSLLNNAKNGGRRNLITLFKLIPGGRRVLNQKK